MKTMKNPAASCLYFLHLFVMAVSGGEVTGSVNDTLTLPCTYIIHKSQHPFCWGRGGCSLTECNNNIIRTDGQKVTWRKSDRYQLLGNISQGDVSLTITGATNEDEGTYCCLVHIPGLFNDMKEEVNVKIQEGPPHQGHPTFYETHDSNQGVPRGKTTTRSNQIFSTLHSASPGSEEEGPSHYHERFNWNRLANLRWIIILLLPAMFLLIYKCCSL
ncbi:hepatitis A virus cellular receptor 1 homolog [Bufo gargarizans]|uniref:hepatitis A virus cellular receptor 1 homolog n=1 Tax=Bufo gargarizans TaxID=30331 RepID=UPI001CF36BDA|nr:hepatitis A virus cellular receptor 1 homolog [Bufo gargarizans]